MSTYSKAILVADQDLSPDAAVSALQIGWQASANALTKVSRGDFVAGLTSAHAACKAMQAAIDTLTHLAGKNG